MKKIKLLFLFLFFTFVLLFSGCGTPDCSEKDTTYTKYSLNEETNTCEISKQIPKDECGNGIAEKGETYCNCDDDVIETAPPVAGGCSGSKGDFLEYACDDRSEECVLEETKKVLMSTKVFEFKSGSYFAFDAKVNYMNPFMIDRHNVVVDFTLKNFMDTDSVKVRDLLIKKIYIVTSSNELLGEKTVDLEFNKQYDEFTAEIPLDMFSFEEFEKDVSNVNLKLLITYTKETYSKDGDSYILYKSEELSLEPKQTLERQFKVIDPDNDYK